MKSRFTNFGLSLFVAAMAGIGLVLPNSASAQTANTVYKITFGGRGESKTVDKVLVENLSNGNSVELRGQDILLLSPNATAINSVEADGEGDVDTKGGNYGNPSADW